MIATDTVIENANDLNTTDTPTQTTYNHTKSLGYHIVEVLKLCSATNAKKISALTKEACTALGLPLDTKGGNKPPEHNVAIFEWLRDNKSVKQTDSTHPPIIEPVAPAEIVEAIEPKPTTDLFTLETVTPSNQVIITTDLITEINNQIALAESNADKALEFQDKAIAHSQNAGVLLLQVKATLPHGAFTAWLAENIDVSERQAQRYMRSAKGLPVLRSITKTDTVSVLNSDVDLVAQVELLETESLRAENEKLQNELLKAQQAADDLRNQQAQIIEAKVSAAISTERADLVVENSSAIQSLEKQLSDAQDKIAQQKKELEKSIKDSVARELGKMETEINQTRYRIEMYERDLNDLKKVKLELDAEVGALAVHTEAIKEIQSNLSSLALHFSDAFDTNTMPPKTTNDWQKIKGALQKLMIELDDFVNQHSAIDGAVLVGELVN